MLRLFGVSGLDRTGRPLAGAAVDRWLAGSHGGLGAGIALSFAMALLEYDLEPQQLAMDVASGAVDLALEAELLREPDRRALAETEADYMPHHLTAYLFDLAKSYFTFYESCPVLKADTPESRTPRLIRSDLTARTIRQGLSLLGIGVVEKM